MTNNNKGKVMKNRTIINVPEFKEIEWQPMRVERYLIKRALRETTNALTKKENKI